MKKILVLWILIISSATVAFSGIFFTARYMSRGGKVENTNISAQTDIGTVVPETAENAGLYTSWIPEATVLPSLEMRIIPEARMAYEYYYESDGKTVIKEEEAKYFHIGMTKDEIKEMYKGWELIAFSADETVLRKTIEASEDQKYIVGVQDGYITVFYEDDGKIKEVTNTPITPLSIEEQERLISGIRIRGELNLMKLLEDYGS